MDTLNTLLIGWIFFAILGLFLCKFLFDKYINVSKTESEKIVPEENIILESEVPTYVPKEISRKPTIVPDECPAAEIANTPVGAGADPDAVRWANNVFTWLYNGNEAAPVFTNTWLQTINDFTNKTALETGVLVEVLELMHVTPAPKLTNVVVDCSPADNISITCDCCCILYLRVQTTRTQRDVTTESEYACVVRPLRGRLNIAAIMQTLTGLIKFDGWPEVSLQLEGIRNNSKGFDESQLQEVVREVLTSALRNIVLDVSFHESKTFPKFMRARQVADPVLPVGYDAMVRQTHPPSHVDKIAPKSKPLLPLKEDQVLMAAGESFTAMSYPSLAVPMPNFSQVVLTTSEEQLVRNLQKNNRNDSLTDSIDIPTIIAEYTEEEIDHDVASNMPWESNYIPAGKSFDEAEEMPASSMNFDTIEIEPELDKSEEPVTGKFILMVSSREKLIDEPRPKQVPATDTAFFDDELEDDYHLHDGTIMREQERQPKPLLIRPNKSPILFELIKEDELQDQEELKTNGIDITDEPTLSLQQPQPVMLQSMPPALTQLPEAVLLPSMQPVLSPVMTTQMMGGGQLPIAGMQASPFVTAHHGAPMSHFGIPGLNGKRLLVKIVKAVGIGCDKPVIDSYAVVEMDEPAQKFTTSVIKESNSPFWDEQFLFDLSEGTLEILFELYDKSDNSFYGLGIVGIEELIATPSQRQIIPLQSRPYEDDQVSGSLTVEFLFLDRADFPELALRSSATSHSVSPKGLVTTTTTTYIKPPDNTELIENGEDSVASAVLRDLEEKQTIVGPVVADGTTKSTMVIHASRKPELDDEEDEMEQTSLASWRPQSLPTTTQAIPFTAPTTTGPHVNNSSSPHYGKIPDDVTSNLTDDTTCSDNTDRGRSRRKKDSFFGSLKKRFSRSKLRSKSMDPDAGQTFVDAETTVARSISMERSLGSGRSSGLLTVPGGRGDGGSTRSSLSEMSAISGSSTRTYINENSSLIVETIENSVVKHYLIPLSLQNKSKWRKKGTKLHVYNEHIFVAKHMSSSTPCQVCHKALGRRFGKQGYECRDCGFKTHKPCHVRMDTICPNSTLNTMDLVMVKDTREERRTKLKTTKS